jgi:hypothetical protein
VADDSTTTRREAPRARERLSIAWVVFPVVIGAVVVTVVLIGRLL